MKPSPVDFFADMDDHGSTVAMDVDVDDVEALELLGEGPIIIDNKLADADFFNSFDDDFDDTDIN
ncbi:Small acidic protein [Actinidia chinensis var. chinensis]|uniref:Small acidic protein 1 n=2 Tax=Actinidia TaxID=3624 RepID=A0A7J0D8E9_9ERIC|nr:Small acidic protein [Actinidia chinensis var. chinensis]PSS24018.1 Small acidic protein [Actinidia chinensis var. chinensis]GFS28379.1 small acidic protein 1 [Actinidia rufa]GFY80242.1 small acidic protein 1 [Actinidia rufa]